MADLLGAKEPVYGRQSDWSLQRVPANTGSYSLWRVVWLPVQGDVAPCGGNCGSLHRVVQLPVEGDVVSCIGQCGSLWRVVWL